MLKEVRLGKMKKLQFEVPLTRVNKLEEVSFSSVERFIEAFSRGFLGINVILFSDKDSMDKEDLIAFENIKHLTNFVVCYVFNILLNNKAAKSRKSNPYDVNLVQKISFLENKFQFYIFLDDAIFGLVVGTKFGNVLNLIQCLFPMIAKTDYLNEVRFFPISRQTSVLNEKIQ